MAKRETIDTTSDMRAFLLERMVHLIEGKETVQQSQAVANLARQVNATLALEVQAMKMATEDSSIKAIAV